MKNLFLTESKFKGKVPRNHPNCRTEYAWMIALDAFHLNMNWNGALTNESLIKEFDNVFIIWPKRIDYYKLDYPRFLTDYFKENDLTVISIQEGPVDNFQKYDDVKFQTNFLQGYDNSDIILAHNEFDKNWFRGFFPNHNIYTIPTLMITDTIEEYTVSKREGTMLSGNFTKWYNGFGSYKIAEILTEEIHVMKSGRYVNNEDDYVDHVHDWMRWDKWMELLSGFKYGVNMMPTAAAGTFSLNCAYFGIPCIGNRRIDTQRTCFPDLSIDWWDIETGKRLAEKLYYNKDFYEQVSGKAFYYYLEHYTEEDFKNKMKTILQENNE